MTMEGAAANEHVDPRVEYRGSLTNFLKPQNPPGRTEPHAIRYSLLPFRAGRPRGERRQNPAIILLDKCGQLYP